MTSTSLPHEWIPAINFNQRRGGQIPEILLLHYTGTPTAEYALELLTTDAGRYRVITWCTKTGASCTWSMKTCVHGMRAYRRGTDATM
jgi:hypothetical protein